MVYAGRCSFSYLRGVFAFLVVSSWAHFKTVVAPGSLPKSSHGGPVSDGVYQGLSDLGRPSTHTVRTSPYRSELRPLMQPWAAGI